MSLWRERRSNVALMTVVLMVPVLAAVGLAVDATGFGWCSRA